MKISNLFFLLLAMLIVVGISTGFSPVDNGYCGTISGSDNVQKGVEETYTIVDLNGATPSSISWQVSGGSIVSGYSDSPTITVVWQSSGRLDVSFNATSRCGSGEGWGEAYLNINAQ